MNPMTSSRVETADLLDLKLLPAWVKEPVEAKRYADVEVESGAEHPAQHHRRAPMRRGRSARGPDRSRAGARRPVTNAGRHEAGRDSERFREQRRRARRQ